MFLSKLCLWPSILVSTAYCSFKNPYCPIIYQGEISVLDKLFEILSLVLLNNIPVPFIIIWVPQMFAIYTHTICFILYHHAFYWWKNSTLNHFLMVSTLGLLISESGLLAMLDTCNLVVNSNLILTRFGFAWIQVR